MTTKEQINNMSQSKLDSLTAEDIDILRTAVVAENVVAVAEEIAEDAIQRLRSTDYTDPYTGKKINFKDYIGDPKNEGVKNIFLSGITSGITAGMYRGEELLAELLDGSERLPLVPKNKGGHND